VASVLQPAVVSWGTRQIEGGPEDSGGYCFKDGRKDPLTIFMVLEATEFAVVKALLCGQVVGCFD
jgi:hypothetical protein